MTDPATLTVSALPARSGRIRGLLLTSLQGENIGWVAGGWGGLFVVAALILFWPAISPFAVQVSGDAAPEVSVLSPAELRLIAQPTQLEVRRVAQMAFMRLPLRPGPPPPQAAAALPSGELFGVPTARTADFDRLTRDLRQSSAQCTRWIGGGTPVAGASVVGAAQSELNATASGAGKDRTAYHYHQGLINLCGPNGATALKEFQTAWKAIDDYASDNGGRKKLRRAIARRLAQYETLTDYGMGLAELARLQPGASPAAADQDFVNALKAAKRIRAYEPPGPFVRMARSECEPGQPNVCDLFEFSTAEIYNARLFAWLAAGNAKEAYARTQGDLVGAPTYVAQHPALAANFATAAAANGDADTVKGLYAVVRADLENGDPDAAAWRADRSAVARLSALAAMEDPDAVYSDGDSWWPVDANASPARTHFEAVVGAKIASWFPSVALDDASDVASVDIWLWLRRDRFLLSKSAFELFRQDGATISSLGPADREFVEQWRHGVTGELGQALLDRAELMRRNDGMKAAAPLLQMMSGPDFPLPFRAQARLSLARNAPPGSVIFWSTIILIGIALLGTAHLNLSIGYARTFTRRHHGQRVAFEQAAVAGAKTKGARS